MSYTDDLQRHIDNYTRLIGIASLLSERLKISNTRIALECTECDHKHHGCNDGYQCPVNGCVLENNDAIKRYDEFIKEA